MEQIFVINIQIAATVVAKSKEHAAADAIMQAHDLIYDGKAVPRGSILEHKVNATGRLITEAEAQQFVINPKCWTTNEHLKHALKNFCITVQMIPAQVMTIVVVSLLLR